MAPGPAGSIRSPEVEQEHRTHGKQRVLEIPVNTGGISGDEKGGGGVSYHKYSNLLIQYLYYIPAC